MDRINMFAETCKKIESEKPIPNIDIFNEFNLLEGHPWEGVVTSEITNYYSCLYNIVKREKPKRILEIGTAFGLSAASMLKASPEIELFVTVDLGIYGDQLGFSQNNIEFARTRIHHWCCKKHVPLECVRFYRANSQPEQIGDNENSGAEIHRWHQIPELVRLLTLYEFDVIFVDGKHTDDGLFNDFVLVWPMLCDGGLLICDDLHDGATYKNVFPWAGQTLASFHRFADAHLQEIEDTFIWNYPRVIPADYTGLRPFGLIRRRKGSQPVLSGKEFEVFDVPEALSINRARQDHLASLGLDLAHKTILEVGSGVGRHTGFFEKLGCTVFSTDARPENTTEHLRRYPYRKGLVAVADLNIPGSHKKFGKFDVVYCYGTLYHLGDPALCLKDLSENCRELFLLETCVNSYDNNNVNCVPEESRWKNQSFDGTGCRPARDWIVSELKKYYPYVYCTRYQPAHGDFPLKWPANPDEYTNTRSVIVASRNPLENRSLISEIPNSQKQLEPVISSIGQRSMQFHRKGNLIENGICSLMKKMNPAISVIILNKKGKKLAQSLDVNIYGNGQRAQVLVEEKNGLKFVPTDIKDHLATPFFDLSVGKRGTEIHMILSYPHKCPPDSSMILYFQDSAFNRISDNFDLGRVKNIKAGYLQFAETILLSSNISKFRIIITSTDAKPINIPVSIKIERLKYLF
jgi:predicted O-methyltransferase YrrM/SAM-dependent methyltransferase